LGTLTLPTGAVGTLTFNNGNNTIDLQITTASSPLVWNGGSGNWDIATTANWADGLTYLEGNSVLFDDTSSGTAPFTVNLPGNVNPGYVSVDNPTKDYTLSGPGVLGGDTGLIKRGAGTLMLSVANTSSGGITLNSSAGTVNATLDATQDSLGTGPVAIGSDSTLVLDNINTTSATITKANSFSGSGLLKLSFATDTTARTTALPGLSGFAGTVKVDSAGSGTGDKLETSGTVAPLANVQIANGNTLLVGSTMASFNTISVLGTGNSENSGAIRMGSSATMLAGAITLFGDTTIASDATVAILTGSISGSASAGSSNVLTQGTAASAAGCTLSGAISDGPNGGKVALSQTRGILTLSGANTYSGLTTVNGNSTLQLGATDTLPINGAVILGDNNNEGNLHLGTFSQTLEGLTALSIANIDNLITISTGQSLTINGSSGIFVGTDVGDSSTTRVKMDGGGALVVTNATANVTVGKAQSDESGIGTGSLDLSELSSVTLGSSFTPLHEVRVAYGQLCSGTLTLSDTDNQITVTTLQVGNSVSWNAGAGNLILGTGTNSIAANTINIGVVKAGGTMKFASQTAGSPGTITIGGWTRSTADFVIGSKFAISSSATPKGILDLRGHVANVAAGAVIMGREDNPNAMPFLGGAAGSILFDSGTFTATNLVMAYKSGSNAGSWAKATATLTVGGGEFTVTDGPITFATQTGMGTANATLNLNGGTFRSYADILTGPSNCTSTINLDGGTLDMTGQAIGLNAQTVTVFNVQSGTLMNLGSYNNGAPLIKTGTGMLSLDGTNNYSGATIVSNGTFRLTSTTCLPPPADLYLTTGTTTQLDYTGKLFIHELYVDGVQKKGSLYGQDNLSPYLSGTGFLELASKGTLIILR
jgi:autotransporter-associated beta strand protein